jgi:hypothetical protein
MMATRPGWCCVCGGIHQACRFGLGMECISGLDCRNPHHRGQVLGICKWCGGGIGQRDDHGRCAPAKERAA